jgi:RNA polymerase sigma factor (sigma-70 family)
MGRGDLATVGDLEAMLARYPERDGRRAWEAFDRRYRGATIAYLVHLRGESLQRYSPIVDDLASEILVRWFTDFTNHRNKWPSERQILPWFITVCRNQWRTAGRQEGRVRLVEQVDETLPDPLDMTAEVEEQARLEHLLDCVERLPVHLRRVLKLQNQGATTQEIARQLGISTGTASNRWRNAIDELRSCMAERHGYDLPHPAEKASRMKQECAETRALLPELLAFTGPDDPDGAATAPLRKHLASCHECQQAAGQYEAFLRQVGAALSLSPDEEELAVLEPRMRSKREAFLDTIGAQGDPERNCPAKEAPGTPSIWSIFFPVFFVPRLDPLDAADAAPTPSGTREQLIQVRDETGSALVEILLSDAGNRLFLTMEDATRQENMVRITLKAESGVTASARVPLLNGSGEWELPGDLVLAGACSVRVSCADHTAVE